MIGSGRAVGIAVLASATVAAVPAPRITPGGWGEFRIGMTESELARRFGVTLAPDDGVNSSECRESEMPGGAGLVVMTERGEVTRITLYHASPLRTDRGLGVGSTAADVRRAYGVAIKATNHLYEDPPAEYLTFRPKKDGNGIRYEVGSDRRVATIHAGRSINYVEGCL